MTCFCKIMSVISVGVVRYSYNLLKQLLLWNFFPILVFLYRKFSSNISAESMALDYHFAKIS